MAGLITVVDEALIYILPAGVANCLKRMNVHEN